jgi:hypothetical protein
MMLATIKREKALEQLDVEHKAVRDLIETLTDEEKTRPDTIRYGLYWDQHLSFQDLLAHLITYEALSIEAVEAWRRGAKHPAIDAMQTESGGRKIHYGGIEERRGRSLAAVLDEWDTTQAKLMETLRGINEGEWFEKAPFANPEPLDLGGVLEIILVAPPRPPYRHLPVHIPDVREYLREMRG